MTEKKKKEIFFHVGLGKTGSTYIQYKVFPKFKDVYYIQRTRYKKSIEIINNTNYDKYLVSNEFDRRLEHEVKKYSKVFPNSKVIIVLRRQDSWIASQYRRFVKNGYSQTFDDFIDIEKNNGFWKQEELYFLPKIEMIQEHFIAKPLVLFHDELKNEPFSFIDRIAEFMNVTYNSSEISISPKHKSYNEKQLKVRRWLNKYFSGHIKESKVKYIKAIQRFLIIMPTRYSILLLALLVPNFLINKDRLIPQESLDKIKEFYNDDWNKCLDYASDSDSKK